jgi:hypothetical protein
VTNRPVGTCGEGNETAMPPDGAGAPRRRGSGIECLDYLPRAAMSLFLIARPPWPGLNFLLVSLYLFLCSALSCFLPIFLLRVESMLFHYLACVAGTLAATAGMTGHTSDGACGALGRGRLSMSAGEGSDAVYRGGGLSFSRRRAMNVKPGDRLSVRSSMRRALRFIDASLFLRSTVT